MHIFAEICKGQSFTRVYIPCCLTASTFIPHDTKYFENALVTLFILISDSRFLDLAGLTELKRQIVNSSSSYARQIVNNYPAKLCGISSDT